MNALRDHWFCAELWRDILRWRTLRGRSLRRRTLHRAHDRGQAGRQIGQVSASISSGCSNLHGDGHYCGSRLRKRRVAMVRRSRIGGEVETQTYKFDDTGKESSCALSTLRLGQAGN